MSITNVTEIELTSNQKEVFDQFKRFLESDQHKAFILRGYAGTGKTTLLRFFIDEMKKQEIVYKLTASTGRAAKIVTNATKVRATTVHSQIYNFKDFNQDLEEIEKQENETGVDKTGQLFLSFVLIPYKDEGSDQRVYIVDEASMISDMKDLNANQAMFGSGKLLTDLMSYDKNAKFVFVGDECQLPPVLQELSPALSATYLKQVFNINAMDTSLVDIVRQEQNNTIVQASHRIRLLYSDPPKVKWGKLPLGNYQHVRIHTDIVSMINRYILLIKDERYESATFITSSNQKCNNLNKLIRMSLGRNDLLQVGDLLLVTQNNLISGFMNGDMVRIEEISQVRYQRAQLSFLKVGVRELATGRRFSQLIIEDILYGNTTNLTQEQQKGLYIDFFRRMKAKGIKQDEQRFKDALYEDGFLNALRCVFGYAITCHKAQGGEWNDVFIDIPRNLTLNAKPSAYQWIYTAVTRAKQQLHIVNDFFISK